MTDNTAPGIYTQPDGDGDDVLGHRATSDPAPDFRASFDTAPGQRKMADDEDVEGHRTFGVSESADFRAKDAAPDFRGAWDKQPAGHEQADDADDAEGHFMARDGADFKAKDAAPDFRAAWDKQPGSHGDDADDADHAEGHMLVRDAEPGFRSLDTAPGQRKAAGGEDDVEGHQRF